MSLEFGLSFKRQYASALDVDLTFDNVTALNAYLSDNARYAGQIVTLKDNQDYIYVLNSTRGSWVQFPSKTYVDTALSNLGAIKKRTTAKFASRITLVGTYSNGSSGVGATYSIDSATWQAFDYGLSGNVSIGDSFLFWTCQNQTHNGIYSLTSGGYNQNSVFTRVDDFDESPSEIFDGCFVFIEQGTQYQGCGFLQTTNNPITIGVSNIVFSLITKSVVQIADEETLTLDGNIFRIIGTYKTKIDESYQPTVEKTTLVDDDIFTMNNSENMLSKIKVKFSTLKTALSSAEFADVQITNLSQNSYFLNTAKSVLSAINSLLTSVSQFFTDTKNYSGNVLSESSKYKVNFTYSGGNIIATMAFVGANTTAFYKLFSKRMVLTTGNINSYTKSATASEGTWFFYIDASTSNVDSPVLVLSKTAWDVKAGHVLLDTAKFNATNNTFEWQAYDKHLYDRNIYWHKNEHTLGAIGTTNGVLTHNNGLSSSSFATNVDNNFGRAMIQLASCVMQDEELTNTVVHSDASVASTIANPFTDYAGVVEQFLGFTAIATTGTTTTSIVFPTSHTLIAGQAVQVMSGNTTTTRGTTTITTGGTGTTFTVASVTGMQSGDAIVIGARIPILYLASVSGSNYVWRKLATTSFLAVSGAAACDATTIASGTMQYNDATAGGFATMNTNRYYCVYLLQTNHYSEPIKAILSQGQSSNGTLATALTENFAQFSNLVGLSALEIQEVVSLKRLTFIYNTGAQFTNTRAKLVDVTNLSFRINSLGNVSVGGGGSSVVSASNTTFIPTGNVSSSDVQNAIVEVQSDVDALELSSRQVSINFSSDNTINDFQRLWRTYQYSIDLTPNGFSIRYGDTLGSTQYTDGTVVAAGTILYLYPNTVPSQTVITFTKR